MKELFFISFAIQVIFSLKNITDMQSILKNTVQWRHYYTDKLYSTTPNIAKLNKCYLIVKLSQDYKWFTGGELHLQLQFQPCLLKVTFGDRVTIPGQGAVKADAPQQLKSERLTELWWHLTRHIQVFRLWWRQTSCSRFSVLKNLSVSISSVA